MLRDHLAFDLRDAHSASPRSVPSTRLCARLLHLRVHSHRLQRFLRLQRLESLLSWTDSYGLGREQLGTNQHGNCHQEQSTRAGHDLSYVQPNHLPARYCALGCPRSNVWARVERDPSHAGAPFTEYGRFATTHRNRPIAKRVPDGGHVAK